MHNENCPPCKKTISWNAVLVGAIVALGLTFLFNLLTLAVGLSLFTKDPTGQMILTFSSFAWILIGGYFVLFVSGWLGGRVVNHHTCSLHKANGCLHGFLIWTVFLIISLFGLSFMASDAASILLKTTAITTPAETDLSLSNEPATMTNTTSSKEAKSVRKKGLATFATFFIFTVGAVGCCAGAHYGVRDSSQCHEKCELKRKESSDHTLPPSHSNPG